MESAMLWPKVIPLSIAFCIKKTLRKKERRYRVRRKRERTQIKLLG
jgi:hypothetical protein